MSPSEASFLSEVGVLVIGSGGCGLCAALASIDSGAETVVIERDATALGSTAMSTGLIPAAGSRYQTEKGIEDSPDRFVQDIVKKTGGQTDVEMVRHLAGESVSTLDWLADRQGVPFSLVESFDFPGHSKKRMHGTPNRTGAELMGAMHHAASNSGLDILNSATVTKLFADQDGTIKGVRTVREDESVEDIGCRALILACSGFGGSPHLVEQFIPEIQGATYFGHPGNKGDAIVWGLALGAEIADIDAYQGHGAVASSYGISIVWAHIMLGGIQVNTKGLRFSDEAKGYSEQAAEIVIQPDQYVWSIYDEEIDARLCEYQDYRDALDSGCVITANDIEDLCRQTRLPETVSATLNDVERLVSGQATDQWGRDFANAKTLRPPYKAVRVNGALFHTQGGLCVTEEGRVKREDGSLFPNLFAGGGAARGISGPGAAGYLSGNGLLTATTLGRLAGQAAALTVHGSRA